MCAGTGEVNGQRLHGIAGLLSRLAVQRWHHKQVDALAAALAALLDTQSDHSAAYDNAQAALAAWKNAQDNA